MITKSDDCGAGVRFVYHEYDYRPNWTTRSLAISEKRRTANVKKTVPKWRDARIARARTEIFEFKLRVRLLRVRMLVASSFLERQFRQFVRAFAVLFREFCSF